MKKQLIVIIFSLSISISSIAQNNIKWDDTQSKNWPDQCKRVQVISTLDKSSQAAFFYTSKESAPRPLIVSLHTWSGGFDQKDTLSWMCIQNDYNYIHPHFRGPNNTPEACGSRLVIQDIDDAIDFAIENAQVDPAQIHIIGASGGGYATLLAYMNTKYQVRTFSAWVPISNLADWYYESVGRKQKYAKDIAQATTGKQFPDSNFFFNENEARKRSPFFMPTPTSQRKKSKLFIYTGIHDGYMGSVPITQSLKFYNKVIRDFAPDNTSSLITTEEMLALVESQNSGKKNPAQLKTGDIHFQRRYEDKIQITVFEGKHEMLAKQALIPIGNESILTIGDSNGAIKEGWVTQLKQIRFNDFIYNTCISGNTIGFDNNGRKELNTLRNADQFLSSATTGLKSLNKIIIMLGTNDCKAVFDDSLKIVPLNMEKLIKKIKAHNAYQKFKPQIYIVSPPPYASDDKLIAKYKGGSADIAWLFPRFEEIATKNGCTFIDTYTKILPLWDYLTEDGIHLKEEGQKMIAKMISDQL